MEYKLKEIAARIKELRNIFGYSTQEMAHKTNVSLEEYEALENGEKDFSFTFIYKCALTFKVEVADIIEGESPTLSGYAVTRNGGGMPIVRREGFVYNNLAPMFKNKMAEPFLVHAPYSEQEQNEPIKLSSHAGQELDIVVSGSLKVQIGENIEVLNAGDTIYYDSSTPHGMIATGGKECVFNAIVLSKGREFEYTPDVLAQKEKVSENAEKSDAVYKKFVSVTKDENGILNSISFKDEDKFNFAFDVVDEVAKKSPDKLAMIHVSADKKEKRFTFGDIKRYSNKTANYFESLGIQKGDRVLVVLKRHYQFWFTIIALHKIGAIIIPATNLLMEHDFDYRFKAAGVKAIVCTGHGEVASQAEAAAKNCPELEIKIMANGTKDGWENFDEQIEKFSDVYERKADSACGEEPMLMFFTSGTTGYPKIAMHNHKYPLGHFITAKYWHRVTLGELHFTISDTGWGKALWGKLYGQWMCETAVFVYDFDKFHADDILPMFKKYNITTFCAPPTMYRFFIKEDLSKYDLSSLKYSTVAGEALNPEVYNKWLEITGLKLMEGFGQTETTLTVANLYGMTPKPGSMGKPSPLYDVDIVDPSGNSVKPGETGEIVIRTDKKKPCGIFMGYYRDEEKTKQAWHDGLYHTGDTAWKDEDGYFWYVGRVDDLIKSSGYRIGPFEIESVIMELPYVLECAVTAAPDEIRGQVVKASIVLVRGKQASDELKKEIQTYVKEHTAPYKYPRIVEFLDELPKTISGKIRRVEIRDNK